MRAYVIQPIGKRASDKPTPRGAKVNTERSGSLRPCTDIRIHSRIRMGTATEISLDSQKDVQFLKSNISLATREKLDTHLPPSAVSNIHDDALRKRVEEMLDEVPAHQDSH
jgi:hypothetical protein